MVIELRLAGHQSEYYSRHKLATGGHYFSVAGRLFVQYRQVWPCCERTQGSPLTDLLSTAPY